jgi:hypothetical protein
VDITLPFTSTNYTPTGGFTRPANEDKIPVYNLPIDKPTYLLGVDAQPFNAMLNGSGAVNVSLTVSFPALPVRNGTNNPINNLGTQSDVLSILPENRLILLVSVQGIADIPGVIVSAIAAPQAITGDNTYLPGPFLGSGKFRTFQAVISLTATNLGTLTNVPVSGMVAGVLYLAPA